MKHFYHVLRLLAVAVIATFSYHHAQASHAMGADISYECIDPVTRTYKVVLRFYRDCSGIAEPSNVIVNVGSASCGQNLQVTLTKEACAPNPGGGAPCEVSPLCASSIGQSSCNGGSLPGVQAFTYTGTVQLPQNCPDWVFSYSECCRNSLITNLVAPDSEDIYVEARLNNTAGICNNSPVFTSLPVPFICANQPFSYNHGAVDSDGDSLVYSLINPLTTNGAPIGYVGIFTPTNPMNTTPPNSFGFSTTSGQMNFTPAGTQVAVVNVLVQEYRNGVLIGSTIRDMQVVVVNLPGCSNPAPQFSGVIQNTLQNGFFINNFHVQVCPGNVLSFNVLAKELSGDSVFVETNIAQSIPDAQFVTNYTTRDSVYGFFLWTPTGIDTGDNIFIVTVKNKNCPLSSTQSYAIRVEVLSGTFAGPDLSYCPAGGPVQLQAYGGTQFTWNPATDLNNPNISNPLATPSQTTTYIVTSNLSSTCKNQDTITVFRVPDFQYTLTQSDDTICRFDFVNIAIQPEAAFAPYSYVWEPPLGLNATNIANPVAQPDASSQYTVKIIASNGCTRKDTVQIVVEGQGPLVFLTADKPKVCPGDTVRLSAAISTLPCGPNAVPCVGNFGISTVGSSTAVQNPVTPYRGFYMDARMQILYRASELQAQGMQAGTITDIAFNIANRQSNIPYNGFTIKMGCTALDRLTNYVPGLPVVINPQTFTPQGTGWQTHTFDTPYDWDGQSNIIIEICFDNSDYTQDDDVFATNTGYNCVLYRFQDNTSGCGLTNPSTSGFRPNTQFIYCVEPPKQVTYQWTPETNLFYVPDTLHPFAIVNEPVQYFLTVDDGQCKGGGSITLNIDTSFNISAGPDVPFCSGVPAQLNAVVTGIPPLSQTVDCGLNNSPCSSGAVLRSFTPAGAADIGTSIFDGGSLFLANEDQRTQILYLASDLQNAGVTAGTINRVSFRVSTKTSTFPFQNVTVKMGCSNKTELDDNGWEPTQTVFTSPIFQTVAGWNDFVLQNTYDWDGTSNLVVEICWDNPDGFLFAATDNIEAAFVNYNAYHTAVQSNAVGCNLPTPTFQLYQELPSIRFTMCPPPPLPVTYQWQPPVGLSSTTIGNPTASPASATTYVVTAFFGGSCPKTDTVIVTPQNFSYTIQADTTICLGQTIQLVVSGGNIYNWQPGVALSCSDCPAPVFTANDTLTRLLVTIMDTTTGCMLTDTVVINAQDLSIQPFFTDTLIDQGTTIELGVSANNQQSGITYLWQPADYLQQANGATTPATPLTDLLYNIIASNGFCSDTAQIQVRVNIVASPVAVPSGFTPNGDGKNDAFFPVFLNNVATVKTFRIYNRYGELVHNTASPWDGTFRGEQQPAGTYTYYLEIERPAMKTEPIQGSVTLIR